MADTENFSLLVQGFVLFYNQSGEDADEEESRVKARSISKGHCPLF